MIRPIVLCMGFLIALLSTAMTAHASINYYSSRAAFDAASIGLTLTVEDFEEAVLQDLGGGFIGATSSGPIDRFTNDGVFSTGDIIPNLSINAAGGGLPNEFFANQNYGPTTVLTTNWTPNFARLDFFEGGVTAFGVDITLNNVAHTLRIFGADGLLDTQSIDAGSGTVFFGLTSTDVVYAVEIQSDSLETFDNVTLGVSGSSAVPEPSAIAIWSLGAIGCLIVFRVKRKRLVK